MTNGIPKHGGGHLRADGPLRGIRIQQGPRASYAVLAVRTAYLKAHYPAEFMAASLTSEMDNSDRIVVLINECRRMGIRVLAPDVNEGRVEFRAT